MSEKHDFDIIIIGAGPGGYVAAIRARQLGLKTAVVEKDKLGGVCLNWGCIPSKALIHQAAIFESIAPLKKMGVKVDLSGFNYSKVYKKSRKAADTLSRGVSFLFKKNGVELIEGEAVITGKKEVTVNGEKKYTADNIIIATGSHPREIPGFKIDEEKILSSTGALGLKELPDKMLVIGSGPIGMELAHVFNAFGVEITVVEILDSILPLEDPEMVAVLQRHFKRRKFKMLTSTKAASWEEKDGKVKVAMEDKEGKTSAAVFDKVLLAVGRAPGTKGVGLENVGIETEKGFIPTGDYYETKVSGIYAIGDVVNSPLLAHVASKEGEIAVEHIAGENPPKKLDSRLIPNAVYTEPQIGSFGMSEKQAKEKGVEYKTAAFPYRGNGKAVAMEESDGLTKVLYDPATHEILGGHAVGKDATEIIHEMLLAKSAELLPEDVATMIHAHPTLSESVMEVMRGAEGWTIHA